MAISQVKYKTKKFKDRKKSKGQFVIEAVLLLSIGLMLLMGLKKWAQDSQIFANILTKPWVKISGMIENGVWGDPASTRSKHPHNHEKVATLQQ
jgi:hypothetical protein